MQYTININQLIIASDAQSTTAKIDLIDAAILEYVHELCASVHPNVEAKRITKHNRRWTWVDYKTLLSEMPLLRIKSRGALTPRFKRLEKAGYIHTTKGEGYLLYVALTAKVSELKSSTAFTNMNGSVHENEQPSPEDSVHENERTIIPNNSSTNNEVTSETDYRKRLETKALEGKQEQTPKVRGKPEAIVVTQTLQAKAQWVVDQLGTEEDEVTSVLKMCKRYSPAEIDQAVRAVIDHPHQRARTRLFFSRLWEIAGVRKAPTYEEFEEDYEEVYD